MLRKVYQSCPKFVDDLHGPIKRRNYSKMETYLKGIAHMTPHGIENYSLYIKGHSPKEQ